MKLCFLQLFPLSLGFFLKPHSLEDCRRCIDSIDDQIYEKLTQRMKISRLISDYKKMENISVHHIQREEEILRRLKEKSGLNQIFVETLWTEIFQESKRVQT